MDNKLELILTARDISAKAFESFQGHCVSVAKQVVSLNGALVTLAGATGMGYFIKQTLDATAELERNAKMAGVGVEAFQELSYAANRYMVTQDALTDGLKELALRADEYVKTGAGPAKEAFDRIGLSQLELNRRLKDTPGLFREIVRRMEGLDKAAQIRIADELFGGTGGEQFVAMIESGAAAIDSLRDEARELGLVLDEDLVRNSIKAKKQVEALSTVLTAQLQVAVSEISPYISTAADGMLTWVKNNREFIGQKVPETIGDISDGLFKIKEFYDSIPQDVVGPAGIGLVGTALLGPKAGFVIGSAAFLFNEFKDAWDGIIALSKGGISWDDVFDEDRFEAALKKYRESLNRPDAARVSWLTIKPGVSDRDLEKELSKHFDDIDAEAGRILENRLSKGKGLASVYDPFRHSWKNLQASANLNGFETYWHKNQDEIKRTTEALNDFFGDIDSLELEIRSHDPFKSYRESFLKTQDVVQNGLYYMEDAMVGWINTGKLEWKDFSRMVMSDISRMFVQKSIMAPISGWFSTLFSAHGNAFDPSGLTAFAHGGAFSNSIVTQPTFFKFGSGGHFGNLGVMGEKGPEVVAPLFRGTGGDVGMKSVPSVINMAVNIINNTGSHVSASQSQPEWDGTKWVLNIVLDGMDRNTMGFRSRMMAGMSRRN